MNIEHSKIPTVHILLSLRHPELLRAATLVFDTLRVGFPTAYVVVHPNEMHDLGVMWPQIQRALDAAAVNEVRPRRQTIHHEYIEDLLSVGEDPIVLLDTDVCLWGKVEDWDFGDVPMAGRYTPAFRCKFANAITTPRLHTSCLFVNPVKLREAVGTYLKQFPDTPFTPKQNLIYPCYYALRDRAKVTTYFSDTMGLMYAAIGGVSFNEQQMDALDHLHFATISDIICAYYPENHWRENHFAVFENPKLLKGAWRMQEEFYRANAV